GSMLAVAATRGMYQLLDAIPDVADASQPSESRELQPLVLFEGVTFGYQGGRRSAVVDCSFELRPGETLGVVGPSGAGKSTLVGAHRLSSIAGVDRVIVMDQGRLIEEGAPGDLLARPGSAYGRLMAAQQETHELPTIEDESSPPAPSARVERQVTVESARA